MNVKDDVSKNWKMFREAWCYYVTTTELKVIPFKLFYYQTFFETWHNHIHYMNIKKME